MTISVLFVCLGNICRSPLAEAAFLQEAEAIGLDVEAASAGTGDWHVGRPADPRTRDCAKRHGVDITHHRARQVSPSDFRRYDHIVALDRRNLEDLKALRPDDATARLSLLLDHVPGRAGESVSDPYQGDMAAFDTAWRDALAGARELARHLASD